VAYFKLVKNVTVLPFAVYANQQICLTVTGVGKAAMAAGVAYSAALWAGDASPVMVNVGIAGHRDQPLGRLFLADKLIDADSRKNFYPGLIFTPPCPTGAVQTASTPQLAYDHAYLADMEATAFYETAARFTAAELIVCLKVVSDNPQSSVDALNPKQVSGLIAAQLPTIASVLEIVGAAAGLIRHPEPVLYTELLNEYRLSAHERLQLKNLLTRWDVITGSQPLKPDKSSLRSGKDLLRWLDLQISNTPFYL
jgi:nucleoside phosphorylase